MKILAALIVEKTFSVTGGDEDLSPRGKFILRSGTILNWSRKLREKTRDFVRKGRRLEDGSSLDIPGDVPGGTFIISD